MQIFLFFVSDPAEKQSQQPINNARLNWSNANRCVIGKQGKETRGYNRNRLMKNDRGKRMESD